MSPRPLVARKSVSAALALLCVALVIVPIALAVPGAPRYTLNAADNKRAQQLLVQKADLLPIYRTDPQRFAEPRVYRCPGLYTPDRSGVTITGSAEHLFTNGSTGVGSNSIGSSAAVFRTAADLDTYWRVTVRPAYVKCLAEGYSKGARPDLHAKVVSARAFAVGPTGLARTAGYQLTMLYDIDGERHVIVRTVVFLAGTRMLAHLVFADVDYRCDCPRSVSRRIALRIIAAERS